MTVLDLIIDLKRKGAFLVATDGYIRCSGPKEIFSNEILCFIKDHKAELLNLIKWPPECLESERKFGHFTARLYPLLFKNVHTPYGKGRLIQVLDNRVGIVFNNERRISYLDPAVISSL